MLIIPNTSEEFLKTEINFSKIIDKKNRQVVIAKKSNPKLDFLNKLRDLSFDNGFSFQYFKQLDNWIFGNFWNINEVPNPQFSYTASIHYGFEAGDYDLDFTHVNPPYFNIKNYHVFPLKESKLINYLRMTQTFKVQLKDKIFENWLYLLKLIRNNAPLKDILDIKKFCFSSNNIKKLEKKIISLVSLEDCLFLVALHNKNFNFMQYYMKNHDIKELSYNYLRKNKDVFHFFSQIKSYEYLVDLENIHLIDYHKVFDNLVFVADNTDFIEVLYEKLKIENHLSSNLNTKRKIKI